MAKTPKYERGVKDGSTPASGEIGEYLTASCTAANTTVSADTELDSTGMSLTLTPGRWLIGYDVSIFLVRVGTTGFVQGRTRITDAANSPLIGSEAYYRSNLMAAADAIDFNGGRRLAITVSTTTTYKLRHACGSANTAGTVTVNPASTASAFSGTNDNASNIWALRIA